MQMEIKLTEKEEEVQKQFSNLLVIKPDGRKTTFNLSLIKSNVHSIAQKLPTPPRLDTLDFSEFKTLLENLIKEKNIKYLKIGHIQRCILEFLQDKNLDLLLEYNSFIKKRKKVIKNTKNMIVRNNFFHERLKELFLDLEFVPNWKKMKRKPIIFDLINVQENMELDKKITIRYSLALYIAESFIDSKMRDEARRKRVHVFTLKCETIDYSYGFQILLFITHKVNETEEEFSTGFILEEYPKIKISYISFMDTIKHIYEDKNLRDYQIILMAYKEFFSHSKPETEVHIWADSPDLNHKDLDQQWHLFNQGEKMLERYKSKQLTKEERNAKVKKIYVDIYKKTKQYNYEIDIPPLLSFGFKGNKDKNAQRDDDSNTQFKKFIEFIDIKRKEISLLFKNTLITPALKINPKLVIKHERLSNHYSKPFDRAEFLRQFEFSPDKIRQSTRDALKYLKNKYSDSYEYVDCESYFTDNPVSKL